MLFLLEVHEVIEKFRAHTQTSSVSLTKQYLFRGVGVRVKASLHDEFFASDSALAMRV